MSKAKKTKRAKEYSRNHLHRHFEELSNHAKNTLKTPNPGSSKAFELGCTCPILDNAHGKGDGPFWISGGCPIHDKRNDLLATDSKPTGSTSNAPK
jgi:hypothetical protein